MVTQFSAIATGILAAASSLPPSPSVDADAITPGGVGFFVFVLLIVAVMLLGWDLIRRIRRISYREEVNRRLDEEDSGGSGAGSD